MYSILAIIYGYPLTEEIQEALEQADEEVDNYFTTYYSGMGGMNPGYVGSELKKLKPTEAFNFEELSKQCLSSVTSKMKEDVEHQISYMPEEIKALLQPIGVYGIWYTS